MAVTKITANRLCRKIRDIVDKMDSLDITEESAKKEVQKLVTNLKTRRKVMRGLGLTSTAKNILGKRRMEIVKPWIVETAGIYIS